VLTGPKRLFTATRSKSEVPRFPPKAPQMRIPCVIWCNLNRASSSAGSPPRSSADDCAISGPAGRSVGPPGVVFEGLQFRSSSVVASLRPWNGSRASAGCWRIEPQAGRHGIAAEAAQPAWWARGCASCGLVGAVQTCSGGLSMLPAPFVMNAGAGRAAASLPRWMGGNAPAPRNRRSPAATGLVDRWGWR